MPNFKLRSTVRHSKRAPKDTGVQVGENPHGATAADAPCEFLHASVKPALPTSRGPEAGLFFIVVFLIYLVSPIISSADSHFVLPTALSIVRHGDANIDEYSRQFSEAPWAVVKENGHFWNVYPAGVPFMIVPLVWVADRIAAVFGSDLEATAIERSPLLLELTFASLITAAAAVLLFCYFRQRLSPARSLLLGGLFALGTAAYSSASRGLWQHGPSMLLLISTVLLYERLEQWKWRGAVLLGFCAGYSYAVRPANLIIPFGFAILLALTARARLIAYAWGAILGVMPLIVFHLMVFGSWSSYYYKMTQGTIFSIFLPLGPLCATLFSPSRGLFIFSPFLLFLSFRFLPSYRCRYKLTPIEILLIALSAAWWIGTARWFMWWGGGAYGPRLLCELVPCATILLIPVAANLSLHGGWKTNTLSALFIFAGALSIAIHFRGATVWAAHDWNNTPIPIDQAPQRVWSWKDPQFLRGFHDVLREASGFRAPPGATPLSFYAIAPCRFFDTRSPAGAFGGPGLIAYKPRVIPVPDGPCGIPHGAVAYSLNLVAIPRGPLGWLNVWGEGEPVPRTSVIDAPTGAVTTNAAIVRAGKDGAICLLATDGTDLVIDINGYFAPMAGSFAGP